MVYYQLTKHFNYLFSKLNPSPSYVNNASRAYNSITGVLKSAPGELAELDPIIFLQGSYKQETAIYDINDIDLVVQCQKKLVKQNPRLLRDELFAAVAKPLLQERRYRDKVTYGPDSMCIKLNSDIKVEILPVVSSANPHSEPFYLFRPESQTWESGFARRHQMRLTEKNKQCFNNFIPAVKVFKHLRSFFDTESVSFHIECFLYHLPPSLFRGSPVEYISRLLCKIANHNADAWYRAAFKTPCQERYLYTASEWEHENWCLFHSLLSELSPLATQAVNTKDISVAIRLWQRILGEKFFPKEVAS